MNEVIVPTEKEHYGPMLMIHGRMHRLTSYGAAIHWKGVYMVTDHEINDHLRRFKPVGWSYNGETHLFSGVKST